MTFSVTVHFGFCSVLTQVFNDKLFMKLIMNHHQALTEDMYQRHQQHQMQPYGFSLIHYCKITDQWHIIKIQCVVKSKKPDLIKNQAFCF